MAADLAPIEILDHLLALAINGLGVAVIILAMAVVMAPDPVSYTHLTLPTKA